MADIKRCCRSCGRIFSCHEKAPDTWAAWVCLSCWARTHPDVVASLSLGGGGLLTFTGPVPEEVEDANNNAG